MNAEESLPVTGVLLKVWRFLRVSEFLLFSRFFLRIASQIRGVLIALFIMIILGGWLISKFEDIGFLDGQYLAFVTALTIGYGDLTPKTGLGKVCSILLGVVGMIYVGLIVGVASHAVQKTYESEHHKSSGNLRRIETDQVD